MLTAGLALLLLCGETTRMLHLSPLLAGMMAGFVIINRAERDVRLFRALNAFEPPIYVLFFTLAGVHLDLAALSLAGWVGLAYFVARIIGKYCGSWLGGLFSGADPMVRNFMGLALVPQAGVAIGLVFMIASDPRISSWATVITPVVLAGVVLSELIGPLLVQATLKRAGELEGEETRPECGGRSGRACDLWLQSADGVEAGAWEWDSLHPASNSQGVVVFGASHQATSRSLTRLAVILAHYYHALPLCVRVLPKAERQSRRVSEEAILFDQEKEEARELGYPLETELLYDLAASGLAAATEYNKGLAVVLGYPLGRNPLSYQKVLDQVAANVLCPVIAVRFVGALSCRRLLVPFLLPDELDELLPFCEAMATAGHPRVTFLQLMSADSTREERELCRTAMEEWLELNLVDTETHFVVDAAESRLESILTTAQSHDMIVMTTERRHPVERVFLGSLANSVVHNCTKTVVVIAPGRGLRHEER